MAEREQQLEELFHAALKRKPDERASFLSEACASDPDLRAQVESLISAHESPGSSFDTPAYETTASMLAEDEAGSHIGRTIGHYEILSLLGKGGMGAVYLAKDARLDRKVALKLLPLQFTANEVRLRRFIREARAASSLNHPNIITIYEIGQDGPAHYIATEYIEGETLRERIARAPIEASEAIDVAAQIAYALAAAHSAGIVHRDIKPENVMARPDGIIKVLDFGLAKLTEQQASNSQRPTRVSTEPGVVLGTVTYMSPEQARGLEVDARTDIWSLGVVIYEMIAGRAPFSGDTTADVIAAILKSEPQPIAELAPETPIALQKIIGRVLSKDRKERYQTSDEMLAELRAVKKETEFAAKLDRSDAQATRSFVPATGRLFSPRPALALLLAAAIIAGIWWAYRRQPEAERPSPRPLVDLHSWKSERGETTLNARLSHDGKMFAYTSARGRWLSIWVKQTQTEAYPVPVTRDNTNNWWPVWSPDDQQLAFISDRGGQNGIWTMPVLGGTPRLLKNIEGPSPDLIHWSRDGNRLYYQWRTNLYSLDVVSGVITQLTDFDPFKIVPFKSFAVSPDENHIAYNDLKDGQVDIWI
ncbi:MAG TPA: protein kinase, partial [Blastocatellia bacterium]|nr:protein kinase [Blastocatellia bacterium]